MADSGIIRAVGGFEFEVTVSEQHTDELTITRHPVERGAPITDHIYRNPYQLSVKVGSSASFEDDLSDLYDQLRAMQVSGDLLEVVTGKRSYDSMLIKTLRVTTDLTTENVLMVDMQLEEVILVDTMKATMPATADRADPQATASPAATGSKSATAYNGPTPVSDFGNA